MNAVLLSVITFISCTECPQDVRTFLNIPAGVKCDMVKWKLEISDESTYTLNAQWGFFPDNFRWETGGELVDVHGTYTVDKNIFTLNNKTGSLSLLKLNANMFHLLDKNKRIATGGEGYANILTRKDPVDDKSIPAFVVKEEKSDFVLTGRTPFKPFDKELPIADNEGHDKIKWMIRFYAGGRLEVREILEHVKDWKGSWTAQSNIYKLEFEGRTLSLLKISDDVFLFISRSGGLISGSHEFGPALIRRPPSGR